MSKVTYDKTLGGPLSTTHFRLQMVDQTLRNLEGLAMDILVKIQDTYIPMDFVVPDMGHNEEVPLLLGRPLFNTTNAVLHMGSWHVSFYIQGQTMRCPFNGFKIRIYFSGHGCTSIKQKVKGEESCSLDFKMVSPCRR